MGSVELIGIGMLRSSVMLLATLFFNAGLGAEPIRLAGSYQIYDANYDNGIPTLVGENLRNGKWFSLIGTKYSELQIDAYPVGVFNGAAVHGGSGIMALGPDGAFGAIDSGLNSAVVGRLDEDGNLAVLHAIEPLPDELGHGLFHDVSGELSAGFFLAPDGLSAFIADGGTRRIIDRGLTSRAQGVDPTTNSGFGHRNEEATEWLPDGTFINFNDPQSGRPIWGEVEYGFGGLRFIRAMSGARFVSDGTTTMELGDYMTALGTPLNYNPWKAFFIGDPETRMATLYLSEGLAGAIVMDSRSIASFRSPFDSPAGNEVPEPSTFLLFACGGFALVMGKKIQFPR